MDDLIEEDISKEDLQEALLEIKKTMENSNFTIIFAKNGRLIQRSVNGVETDLGPSSAATVEQKQKIWSFEKNESSS